MPKSESKKIKLVNLESGDISSHDLLITEGRHPGNGNTTWDVEFDFFGNKIRLENEYFLSGAIDEIRKITEPQSYRMLLKWCELDAVQSGMIADATAGRAFYKYEIIKQLNQGKSNTEGYKEAIFGVLDEAKPEEVVSLQEQEEYRKQKYYV